MVKKVLRSDDGFYHIAGKKYANLEGSRAQVWHGSAYKTPGGLTRAQLFMNKNGHIVSLKKHISAKKERRLEKAGYKTRKGKFGAVKVGTRRSRSKGKSLRLKLGKWEIYRKKNNSN